MMIFFIFVDCRTSVFIRRNTIIDTYYPEKMIAAGKAAYIERNYEMISKSKYCIVFYDEKYAPPKRKNSRFNGVPAAKRYKTCIRVRHQKMRGNQHKKINRDTPII